jgi:hypothetical protein
MAIFEGEPELLAFSSTLLLLLLNTHQALQQSLTFDTSEDALFSSDDFTYFNDSSVLDADQMTVAGLSVRLVRPSRLIRFVFI